MGNNGGNGGREDDKSRIVAAECNVTILKTYLDQLAVSSGLMVRAAAEYLQACKRGTNTMILFEAMDFHTRQTALMLESLGYATIHQEPKP